MDPQTTLWKLVCACSAEGQARDRDEIIELANALAEWLNKGGFTPKARRLLIDGINNGFCIPGRTPDIQKEDPCS